MWSGVPARADIPIYFDTVEITRRRVDFVVWDDAATLLLEVKAAKAVRPEDVEQCLLTLHNGNYRLCLLVNFGQIPIYRKRLVYTATRPALYGPHP